MRERLETRVVPSLEALLGAALERERLQAEVVETQALRRSDELKTALLRSISHDLRTPLTAILTAGHRARRRGALARGARGARRGRSSRRRSGCRRWSRSCSTSRGCEAGRRRAAAASGARWTRSCARRRGRSTPMARGSRSSIDPDLPLVRADAAQLERAFANLLENAVRYSATSAVSVRARVVGERLMVRVVDRGPGIPRERADADLRAVLSRAGQALRAHRVGPRAGDRQGLRRGQRRRGVGGVAARPGHELRRRAAARARAAEDACRERRAARPRLRRRAADRPRAEDHPARRRASRRCRPRPARRRCDVATLQRPDAAILDLVLPDGDGVEVCRGAARVERDADHRALGGGRGGRTRCARSRPAPTTT